MLKILFLLIKFDNTPKLISANLLHYYIFRDRESYATIREIGGIIKEKKEKKSTKKKVKYNLVDIIFRNSPEKMKLHSIITEFYNSKILAGLPTLLDGLNIGKSLQKQSKEKNIFEANGFCFFYLLSLFLQIIHFEFFGISKYEDFPSDEQRSKRLKEFGNLATKTYSNKVMRVVQLIEDIIKSANYNDCSLDQVSFLGGEYTKMMDTCHNRYLTFLNPKKIVKLGSVYTPLDYFCEDKQSQKIIIAENSKEQKVIEGVEAEKTQQEGYETFKKSMKKYIFIIIDAIKSCTKPSQMCDKIVIMILSQHFNATIQPYLLLITSHNFHAIEEVINNQARIRKVSHQLAFFYNDDPDAKKFMKELEERIYEKFGFITVPKEKIERDELREEFEILAGGQYRKLHKEQQSEVGIWFDKKIDNKHKKLCCYVKSKYEKLLRRCPLHRFLQINQRAISNQFKEFIKLDSHRDTLGRAQRLKRSIKTENSKSSTMIYRYLKAFYLKKLILSSVIDEKESHENMMAQGFLYSDFNYLLTRKMFQLNNSNHNQTQELSPRSDQQDEVAISPTKPGTLLSNSAISLPQFDEYIPKSNFFTFIV